MLLLRTIATLSLPLILPALIDVAAAAEAELESQSRVAAARPQDEPSFHANIHRGNVALGGNLQAWYSKYSEGHTSLDLTAEYFFTNRFSAGGGISGSLGKDYRSYGLGPSATYYIWAQDRWSVSTGASLRYSRSSSSYEDDSVWSAVAKIGADYFITPSVSFGPQLRYHREFGRESNSPYRYGREAAYSATDIVFQFNIFL